MAHMSVAQSPCLPRFSPSEKQPQVELVDADAEAPNVAGVPIVGVAVEVGVDALGAHVPVVPMRSILAVTRVAELSCRRGRERSKAMAARTFCMSVLTMFERISPI